MKWRYVLVPIAILLSLGILLRLWAFFSGYTVTSWWRTPWHNAEVGGEPLSLHQFGLAIDVVPVNQPAMDDLLRFPMVGKVVVESDHLHAQVL